MKPVLHRAGPGRYISLVRANGVDDEPFMIAVHGQFRDNRAMCCWVVEAEIGVDHFAQFMTLTEARAYINCWFVKA